MYTASILNSGLKFTGPNGEDLSIAALRGSAPPLRPDGGLNPAVSSLHPKPIAVAVHKHLTSLADQSASSGLTPDTALLLSYIQSQRWRKVLQAELRGQGLELESAEQPEPRQPASSIQLAALKHAATLPSRFSLIHNLSSKLQQDTSKA